jgi:hypothetical protein
MRKMAMIRNKPRLRPVGLRPCESGRWTGGWKKAGHPECSSVPLHEDPDGDHCHSGEERPYRTRMVWMHRVANDGHKGGRQAGNPDGDTPRT